MCKPKKEGTIILDLGGLANISHIKNLHYSHNGQYPLRWLISHKNVDTKTTILYFKLTSNVTNGACFGVCFGARFGARLISVLVITKQLLRLGTLCL